MKSIYVYLFIFIVFVLFFQIQGEKETFLNRRNMIRSTKKFYRKSKKNTSEYMSNIMKEFKI